MEHGVKQYSVSSNESGTSGSLDDDLHNEDEEEVKEIFEAH